MFVCAIVKKKICTPWIKLYDYLRNSRKDLKVTLYLYILFLLVNCLLFYKISQCYVEMQHSIY